MGTTAEASRIVLVLGAGSTLGGAFHAGVLLAMQRELGIEPGGVDTIIGTSGGAITGSLIAAGLGADDLFRREVCDPLSEEGHRLLVAAREGRATGRSRAGVARAKGPARPDPAVSVGARLARYVPPATRPHDHLCSWVDGLLDGRWPDSPRLWLCTVDLRSGRRLVLDRSVVATPGPAVAAACTLPGIHAPVRLGRHRLVDGAVHSIDNLDLAAAAEPDLVVVSSPLTADRELDPWLPLAALRNGYRARTRREVEQLDGGCPVILVQPDPDEVRRMGTDLRANRGRAAVARRALELATGVFGRAAVPA